VHSSEATWFTLNQDSKEFIAIWASRSDANKLLPKQFSLIMFQDALGLAANIGNTPYDGLAINPTQDGKFNFVSMTDALSCLRGS